MNISIIDAENIRPLQEWVIVLTDEERDGIGRIISRLPLLDVRSIDDDTLTLIQLAGQQLTERLVKALISFRRTPNPYGTLLIRNLPTDPQLPPTPLDGRFCAEKHSFFSVNIVCFC